MIRSIAAVLVVSSLPLALACAADNETGIPQLESSTAGWSKVADDFQPPASGPGPVTYAKDRPYVPNNDEGRQVTFRIADLTNPILKPWAIEKMREQNELAAAGKRAYEARASCRPGGVPGFLVMGRVNHEGGDTLVVDTIGLSEGTYVDNYRTPHTTQLHVVERFRVTEGGTTLQVTIRVEDPGAFNMPWSARQSYHRTRTGAMEEAICAENNIAFDASVSEIPKADKPDF
jgi:hypothetical protein